MALLSSNLAATAAGVGTVTSLLEELVAQQSIGCLSIQIASVEWEIALQHGNRVFATHSLDPIEKLDRHLHRLSFQNRALTTELREQVKKRLSDSLKTLSKVEAECSTLRWLLDLACLQETEAEELYRRLTLESLESCLESSGFKHHYLKVELAEIAQQWPTLASVLEQCAEQAKTWRSLAPPILSPYQRPQLSEAGKNLSVEQQGRFSHLLIGFSFRQLSGLFNQDEVTIAQYLQPLILEGMVELLGPHSPYDQIPLVQSNPRISAVHPSSGPEAAPRGLIRILCKRSRIPRTKETATCQGRSKRPTALMNY
jgi:two-component system, chemotaxis family, response regulator PixG